MKGSVFKHLKTWGAILTGNLILAFLVAAFIIPHGIMMGGSTGIGVLITRIIPFRIDTAIVVLVLNIIFLLLGLIFLGKKFFLKTVVSSILYPVLLFFMQRIPGIDSITDNTLLASLFAGCLLGIAVGLVMRVGASTGGTDVLNLMLHKWFHHPVSVYVYIVDIVIILGQAIKSDPEKLLFGAVALVVETLVLEQVMIFGKSQIQIYVISQKYEQIRLALLGELEAGVTMNLIETGHLGKQCKGVLCVIPPRKLYNASELIHSIDPEAFITVTKIKEVRGRGFTMARE